MKIDERVQLFVDLGKKLQENWDSVELQTVIEKAFFANQWFVESQQRKALQNIISQYFDESKLRHWIKNYAIEDNPIIQSVGIVMAGNIPLVGWHDLMTVMMSGNKAKIKLSSKDEILPKYLLSLMSQIDARSNNYFEVVDKLQGFDAVIATGSGTSARYFEYYFGKYPHIIRKNRTSVAILTGDENHNTLALLGEDIFSFFGLGCRNISHFFVPEGYNFNTFFEAIQDFQYVADHNKYFNNYEYHKSLLLLNNEPHLDNGFLLLKKDPLLESPVASLFYSYYKDKKGLQDYLNANEEKLQCIVSEDTSFSNAIPIGTAQQPQLWEYADGVDTMEFLIKG